MRKEFSSPPLDIDRADGKQKFEMYQVYFWLPASLFFTSVLPPLILCLGP